MRCRHESDGLRRQPRKWPSDGHKNLRLHRQGLRRPRRQRKRRPAYDYADRSRWDRWPHGISRDLRKRPHRLRGSPEMSARGCEVCFSSAWEPTPEGERCGHCYLVEEYKKLRTRLVKAETERDQWEAEFKKFEPKAEAYAA